MSAQQLKRAEINYQIGRVLETRETLKRVEDRYKGYKPALRRYKSAVQEEDEKLIQMTSARFYAIHKMIVERLEYWWADDQYLSPVKSLDRICEFAAEKATKNEQQIYIHLFIDLCRDLLKHIDTPADNLHPYIGNKVPHWRMEAVEAANRASVNRFAVDMGDE